MMVMHLILNILTIFCSNRCLQDNEWDFNTAAQVFTQLKVIFFTLTLQHCTIFVEDLNIHFSFFSQTEGKIPEVAFIKWRVES